MSVASGASGGGSGEDDGGGWWNRYIDPPEPILHFDEKALNEQREKKRDGDEKRKEPYVLQWSGAVGNKKLLQLDDDGVKNLAEEKMKERKRSTGEPSGDQRGKGSSTLSENISEKKSGSAPSSSRENESGAAAPMSIEEEWAERRRNMTLEEQYAERARLEARFLEARAQLHVPVDQNLTSDERAKIGGERLRHFRKVEKELLDSGLPRPPRPPSPPRPPCPNPYHADDDFHCGCPGRPKLL